MAKIKYKRSTILNTATLVNSADIKRIYNNNETAISITTN